MRRKQKREARKRGSARMRENGYHPVQIWFSPEEWRDVKDACRRQRTAVATIARLLAVQEARNYLHNSLSNRELADLARRESGEYRP